MKFISLFAGIGGFDEGLHRAGMECAAQVEIESKQRSVLKRHFPHAAQFEDVRHAGKHNLPAVDLICGGSPCQDVSVAGRRAGLAGERSGLFFEYIRILDELKPQWFIFENVPGLLSSNNGRDFATVLFSMVNIGYRVAYRVLDTQYFGAPQRRRRVFVVGHLGDGRAAEVLFERDSSAGYLATGENARDGYAGDPAPRLAKPLTTREGHRRNGGDETLIAGTLAASGAASARPAGQRNELDFLIPFNKQRSDQYASASVGSTLAARDYKDNGDVVVASTVTSWYGQGSPRGDGADNLAIEKLGVRRLTPVECERLQGFPDHWTAYGANSEPMSDNTRYQMLGNAVSVPVAAWIGKRIMEACK